MLQVRNVPDEVHARLEKRAEVAGVSMSAHVLSALKNHLERRSLPRSGVVPRHGTLRSRSPMRDNRYATNGTLGERDVLRGASTVKAESS